MARKAVIIGAGPAGLTAAYELLSRTDIIPIILEADKQVGGLSKTVNHNGNRMDLGGHRFFSKSEKILSWWLNVLPLEHRPGQEPVALQYQNKNMLLHNAASSTEDSLDVMMVRPRKSRIYFQKKFFDYPLQPRFNTLRKLGFKKLLKIAISFTAAHLLPERPEINLAQFFRNRFGKELYETFFKDYTEKVWGVSCESLPSSWGYQRVKDLNFSKAFFQSLTSIFSPNTTLKQEGRNASLIEQFLYPKYGPGQMWEKVKQKVEERGGQIILSRKVSRLFSSGDTITGIECIDEQSGSKELIEGDFFFSTMPIKDLITGIEDPAKPEEVSAIANGLVYRNFIIAGLLIDHKLHSGDHELKDNWIYLQDKEVRAGRLQIFNNWSEYMVKDKKTTWLGMEYFCNEGDDLWNKDNGSLAEMAIDEIVRIGLISDRSAVIGSWVEKTDKAYPAYTGSYDRFDTLKNYTAKFSNLFLVGRNGMHRYNNTDHSMLTAITAVDNIIAGVKSKENIWDVNLEEAYHEEH